MKENITRKILERLIDSSVGAFDLFTAYLNAGYGATPGKIEYELRKVKEKGIEDEELRKAKDKFDKLVYKLKKDGLVNKKGRGKNAVFSLTKKGLSKSKDLKKKMNFMMPEIDYDEPEGNIIILISFDIPESRRRQRDWLRKSLFYLGFTLVHQSVFVGRGKLPGKFLDDLRELELFEFIEIMEIGKSGTLKT